MVQTAISIPFYKLHGNGNDFLLIDELQGTLIPDQMKGEFAELYCDRRFGVGADGVLFLSAGTTGDLKMRLFQPDRSEAEMCGNGIRCFARYAFDQGYFTEQCTIETSAGLIPVRVSTGDDGSFMAQIHMPDPAFDCPGIPAAGEGVYLQTIGGLTVHAANTGVPHAVVIVDDLTAVDIRAVAPMIRHHLSFAKGANVNFVQVTGPDAIQVRTYERGVEDETLSCGTGATASAAVAHRLGLVGDHVAVETSGGPLWITLGVETLMEGPAVLVFFGEIPF
jgi:diaminopimelate epimerase